jgi:hypothetical protein
MKLNNSQVVGVTSVRICPANKKRTSLVVFNNTPGSILYLGTDPEVSATNGLPVFGQTGQSFLVGLGDDPTVSLFGIGSAAGIDVRWFEMCGEPSKIVKAAV